MLVGTLCSGRYGVYRGIICCGTPGGNESMIVPGFVRKYVQFQDEDTLRIDPHHDATMEML